ncbi:proline racemase family protein [Candidatus Bipolaricaulota bacterium]|nr:proline racemase family protein [Candidatus Bipolaricaulota bacterium]
MIPIKDSLNNLKEKSFALAVDAHTAGEPIRVILNGYDPALEDRPTMVDRQKWIWENQDQLRTRTMKEPRGHAAMFGAIVMEPAEDDADIGVLFPYPAGYADMCGHGAIGVATVLSELGLLEVDQGENVITMDTPAGTVKTVAHYRDGRVDRVDLFGTPSYFFDAVEVEVPGPGEVSVELSYGGNIFGIVEVEDLELSVTRQNLDALNSLAHEIMKEINDRKEIKLEHPETGRVPLERIRFVEGEKNSKNVVIHEGAVIDRSPCGTGTCSQIAWEYYSGELALGEGKRYRSIIDTEFKGEAVEEKTFDGRQVIVPKVTGSSYITGLNYFVTSPGDPLVEGFTI